MRARGRRTAPHLALILTVMLVASLAACAKKSYPTAPKDEPDTYHRVYPSE